jgi:opacity protein-like surface antigen
MRIDKSFSDIFTDLELAGMLSLEANNGTWGVAGDLVYVKLKSKQETPIGDIRGRVEEWIVSAASFYRVISDEKLAVDIGAGGRYITADVDINGPASSASRSRDWIDPVVMARARVQLAEKFAIIVTGDIGGFGIESDLTWEIIGTASYSMTDSTDFLFGYRYLDYDYSDGDEFTYDISTSGFILGARFDL